MDYGVQNAIVSLTEAFSQSSCLVFVGHSISAPWVDDHGQEHLGLPSFSQLLEKLRQGRDYITEEMSLKKALGMMSAMVGRNAMISFLKDNMNSALMAPPPAYQEIAKLPLSAIVTTSWNTFIEAALRKDNVPFQMITRDVDIPFVRSNRVPLLKLHGSLEHPDSIVATTDDLLETFHRHPLLADFLRVLCAQKAILFIGYDLDDPDFMQLFRVLRRDLGALLPVSYAVLPSPSPWDASYWRSCNVQVVSAETLDFLQRLNSYILFRHISPPVEGFPVSWTEDPFLRKILGIGRLPTANRIIDGVSRATLYQLEGDLALREISQSVEDAVRGLTDHRPKHRALIKLRDEVVPQWFPPSCPTRSESMRRVSDFIEQRDRARKLIGQQGARIVETGDSILVYSQSTCVLEVINTYLNTSSSECRIEIVVAECRPKSSESFQDALTIVRQIDGFRSPFRLIPDAAVGYLMKAGKISKVFMGSHGVMLLPDGEVRVTNTVGTFAVCLLAAKFSLPVYVFAEEGKMHVAKSMDEASPTAYNLYPEELLLDVGDPLLCGTLGGRQIQLDNPGYDDVSSHDVPFSIITEERVVKAGPSVPTQIVHHSGLPARHG